MSVKELKNEGLKREFEVTIKAADIESEADRRLVKLAKKIKMAGFRPGKVPFNLVKKKHGNEVLGEVLEYLVAMRTQDILDKKKIYPSMQPKIDVSSFEPGKDLTYKISLEVYPEVPEADFSKVKITKSVADVGEDDINEGLERLQQSQKSFEPVKIDRKAKKGDAVLIDFKGSIDGVPFDGGAGEDFQLELGSGQFIPGFEDQLIGVKKGDKITVKVPFPKDYGSKDLAGKSSEFAVDVKDVLESSSPELNDEFASKLGLESLEKLKEAIKEQIERDFENVTRTKVKKELFDALDKACKFETPENMLELEIKSIKDSMANFGEADAKDSKKQEKEFKEIAERRVRLGILLADIGRKNSITVSEDELRRSVFDQARNYPGQEQKVIEFYQKNSEAIEQLKGPILEDKVVDFVLGKASVTEKRVPTKELLKFNEE